ncbi:Uncharacterised protein [Enterobacter cancerogenus]|uniref:Uncharacterized protein n=1 Tax=Enterobacter cancerogenus TaxID=69218 RepID=A0A484W9V2_9ENTR|nr:Uncharacterised protein [Enterobacter cancerogenus]
MQNLQGNFTAFFMHRVGSRSGDAGSWAASFSTAPPSIVTARNRGATPPVTISAYPVPGALGVESGQPLGAVRTFLQSGVHRTHQHAVFEAL